ncbi:FHA domain-containing protein [Alkaliphilus sp. MSJ-5]|uniref:FHA domain-containing protein n=1 Tax=Alkaliphilus flagellatus TaxID=2841507 RepID=A0ABS6G598_9FIRM|nr:MULTISPECIES: FHA domain-containing protein [Alkaliphilus]MBU5676575.1 FHA domain-containing protein [Alkaliphilus flagellatus]QUH19113.1 FHA domain-containing protein [Alkaliphilus sp. B6464]
MFKILSWIIRYLFIILIYYFLYGIIRLIYLDIQSINKINQKGYNNPYLKLINRKERLDFDIQEFYDLKDVTTIGRAKGSTIQLLDKYISSNHVKITMDEGEYFLEDQGSVNGTYLNSTKIEDVAKLKNGDRIGIGQVEFLFVKEVVE